MQTTVKITVTTNGNETSHEVTVEDGQGFFGRVENVFIKLQRVDDMGELADSYEVEREANDSPDGA